LKRFITQSLKVNVLKSPIANQKTQMGTWVVDFANERL